MTTPKYVMRISRLTVDKLGVKLYDKVSAVIAELVSNSYDADAISVTIEAPMGEYLASTAGGTLNDLGLKIVVADDGCGMTPQEMQSFFLMVGSERRIDPKRGSVSKTFKRHVTGRKGVGKLAPFGICQVMEVISSGGPKVSIKGPDGKTKSGYLTSHIVLKYKDIKKETDDDYLPEVGAHDQTLAGQSGTKIILRQFAKRKVPDIETLARQLSQRFGMPTANWAVTLKDTSKQAGGAGTTLPIGTFNIDLMENTRIDFLGPEDTSKREKKEMYRVIGPQGPIANLECGFEHDGAYYPIQGWVGYSKAPYKDELMSGVRIYCRGKIAAQTVTFGHSAGFTGEHQVRSYLVGALHANWLDQEDDLIQTDRRDILWSDDLAAAFQKWGQDVVKRIGTLSRNPMKKTVYSRFAELSDIEKKIEKAFPGDDQKEIRSEAKEIAKLLGSSLSPSEVEDTETVADFVDLALLLAPHVTLDQKLRDAADEKKTPSGAVSGILRAARLAELASFGRIADDRVRVIERLERVKDSAPDEMQLQKLIEEAPWLINPQWAPITANESLKTLADEFRKHFKAKTGSDIVIGGFSDPNKRPDFVLTSQDGVLELIEIKKPGHHIDDTEMQRIITYNKNLKGFLEDSGNKIFAELHTKFRVTLVADGMKLSDALQLAYNNLEDTQVLRRITWASFLMSTRKMHQSFLAEAERQKKIAVQGQAK
jgi:hypothetical protein